VGIGILIVAIVLIEHCCYILHFVRHLWGQNIFLCVCINWHRHAKMLRR